MRTAEASDSRNWLPGGEVITSNQASTTSRVAAAVAPTASKCDRRSAKNPVRASTASRMTSNPTQAML